MEVESIWDALTVEPHHSTSTLLIISVNHAGQSFLIVQLVNKMGANVVHVITDIWGEIIQ